MNTDRCVKWSRESKEFFSSAEDNSVILDIVISHACRSQTGEGFEELVNSINSKEIKRKIKRVNILDTSYLNRHIIPILAKYADAKIPMEWYLNNKATIEKLETSFVLRSWTEEVNTPIFRDWFKQIMIDYAGDRDGNGIVQEFRDLVIYDSAIASYKSNTSLESCIDFMLEECAHACMCFHNTAVNLVYPMKLSDSIIYSLQRYYINIKHLSYKTSKVAEKNTVHPTINTSDLEREITSFMKDGISNVNFFVIDKQGNHIYRNTALDNIIGEINAKELDPKAWINTCKVMREKKQITFEEYNEKDEMHYLSIKTPLIINNKVEGVIGLAIDITDRKRTKELVFQNELQEV
jgi:hypothetical protein